ncbi:MAG: 23S rRNA (uracil(1939)-C(5))-methyltransferase RlmD, partial [Clostridia bacterium]|nr:23S rRNA (uracil(1939)-C(5))-methyltransferase RlmD [Clostridia bacterium]
MLKKNTVYTVKVQDLNNLGFGVAKVEGMTVFVSGAVDGDEIDARIIHATKTYAVARTEKIHVPSPHRTSPLCAVKGCGGCSYAAVSYAHEKQLKEEYVRHAFRKAGLKEAVIAPLVSADKESGYRNKAQYAVAPDKEGKCAAGFFAAKSHRLCEAADCPLQAPEFPPIVKSILAFCHEKGIAPYDEQTGKGLLRHIYLRRSVEGKVLLTLVLNGEKMPCEKEFLSLLSAEHPCVTGVYLNVNRVNTKVICSEDYRHLWGDTHLYDTLCGVRLALSPASFYQVNHAAATMLYEKAAELAELKE